VGKHTLVKEAIKKYGNLFELKRSVTTRKPKSVEKGEENFLFVND